MKQSLAPNKLHILFMSFPSDEHDARNSPRPRLVTQGTFTYALLRDVCGGGDKGPACGRALANLRMRFPGDPPNAAQRGSRGILGLCSLRVCMHTAPSSYTRVRVWEPYAKFSRVLGSDTELAVLIRLATCLCLGRHYGIFHISCFISYGSRDALSVWLAVHYDKSLS